MSIPKCLEHIQGEWAGPSKLFMHGEPERVCDSTLRIASAARNRFLTLSYTWSVDGEPAEGVLTVGLSKAAATASWIDSWHNHDDIMNLKGEVTESEVRLKGSFSAPPGPDWGWRIVLTPVGADLKLTMFCSSPEGQEEPAVEAIYKKR